MSAPNDVLLIRKQDLKSFFEENKVRDNITSFTTTHNAFATNQYVFRVSLVSLLYIESYGMIASVKIPAGDLI